MRAIAIAIFPGVQALDVVGPVDVFAEANSFVAPDDGYAITLVSAVEGAVRASNGMRMLADITFAEANTRYDTALVASLSDFLCDRGHEIIPKGKFHD
ncbi:DJ-1/PfpI family protein [Collimonas sp. OK307]|nr:DJ-1/PfpI family protein [Collimonas sp. OK307]